MVLMVVVAAAVMIMMVVVVMAVAKLAMMTDHSNVPPADVAHSHSWRDR